MVPFSRISSKYYWTGMRKFIADYVKSCSECIRYKATNQKPAGLLQTPVPTQRFESIAIDLLVPYQKRPKVVSALELDNSCTTVIWFKLLEERGLWKEDELNVRAGDESRFNLSNDDNRVRLQRSRGKRPNPVFALQRHTVPTAGVMVRGAIAYNTRSPLVLIHGTITAQRYVHDILQQHVLPLIQQLPGASFQLDNARTHTARVSQDCLKNYYCPFLSDRSPDLSPIEPILDHLGRLVGHPTSLNELEQCF
ncbi:transposable element Tcb2 transposase [Trichonephila clavipes]|nr:transposable element Tcb2 transposase [Trichonephila clavipes]